MAFPLRITFAGMCMLVRDEARKDGRTMLHVLMPPVTHHAHLARLVFETRLQDGASPAADLTHVPLDHLRLDLTGLVSSTSSASFAKLPSDIFDFSALDPRPIERAFFEADDTFGRVLSRVSLAAGEAGDHARGGAWTIMGPLGKVGPRPMATSVQWVIPSVPQNSLILNLKGLNRRANGPLLELKPVNGTDEIHLLVLHALEPEIPRKELQLPKPTFIPPKNFIADHFEAHYNLWDPRIESEDPAFDSELPLSSGLKPGGGSAPGSELTCMIATAKGEAQ